jgi:hypothetical protein
MILFLAGTVTGGVAAGAIFLGSLATVTGWPRPSGAVNRCQPSSPASSPGAGDR